MYVVTKGCRNMTSVCLVIKGVEEFFVPEVWLSLNCDDYWIGEDEMRDNEIEESKVGDSWWISYGIDWLVLVSGEGTLLWKLSGRDEGLSMGSVGFWIWVVSIDD